MYFVLMNRLRKCFINRELCTTSLIVIPVVDDLQVTKAGIQETIDNTGFPPSRE